MKGFNYPLFNLTFCLILGIIVQRWVSFSLAESVVFCSLSTFLALFLHFLFRHRKNFWLSLPLYFSFLSLGLLVVVINNPLTEPQHFSNHETQNAAVCLRITEVLKPTSYASRYVAETVQVNGHSASGKLLVNIPRDSSDLSSRDENNLHVDGLYSLKTTIETVRGPRNPYQFDYSSYLANLGIYGQVYTKNSELLLIDNDLKSARGFAARIRSFIQQRLPADAFAPREWGVINALLLGQRQQLSEQTRQNYIDAGVVHILAISGLHVGIVLFILQLVFKPLGNSRNMRLLRSLLIIMGIWAFALLAGLSPSVLRAAAMFSFLQIGISSNRKSGGMNGLIASALVLLVIDPYLLFQVGFQLSYAAVFSILWLQPSLYRLWEPKNRVLRYFWGILTVTITAQLGVLPLSLFYFHQFSGLFLITNLLVIPLLGMVLAAGIFILFLAVFDVLPSVFAEFYALLVSALNELIFRAAGFEALVSKNIYFNLQWLLLLYVLIAAAALLFKKLTYPRVMAFLVSLLLVVTFDLYEKRFSFSPRFYMLHNYKNTLLVRQNHHILQVYHDKEIVAPTLALFQENNRIETVQHQTVKDYYSVNGNELLVIDSLGIYDLPQAQPDYILLRQSPKINLERLLKTFPNAEIIADGSNYRSYVNRWKLTCAAQKTPFHNTYEKGAFLIK